MTETDIYDIAIIGGGPVGMFAGFYAGLRNTKTILIESLATLGGQVTALYPEKNILDVAGFPSIKGSDLIESLQAQLDMFPITIKTNTTVVNVAKQDKVCTILLKTNTIFTIMTLPLPVAGIQQLIWQQCLIN